MIQSFKYYFWSLTVNPGHWLFLLGTVFYFCGLLTSSLLLLLFALAVLFFCMIWQRTMKQNIGNNFVIYESVPFFDGKPYMLFCQRKRKDAKEINCKDLLYSLIDDKQTLPTELPKGNYCAITHDNVLHIIEKCENITLDPEKKLVCKRTLRSILKAQTNGRCKHCKARCRAWNEKTRNFYLVRFTVS